KFLVKESYSGAQPSQSCVTPKLPSPAKEFISFIPVVGFMLASLNHGNSGLLTALAADYFLRRGQFRTRFVWPPPDCAIRRGTGGWRQRELFYGQLLVSRGRKSHRPAARTRQRPPWHG